MFRIGPKGKRIFALALAVLMALMFVAPALSTLARAADSEESDKVADAQEKMADLNEKYKQLQAQQTQIQAQLNQAAGEKQRQLAAKAQIDTQINTLIEQIDLLDERVLLLEERISQKEVEMEQKEADIEENFDLFKKRLNAMYRTGGNTSTVGLMLGADSYSQFLMRAEVVGRVAEHDRELLARLTAEKEELEEIKRGIEADKEGVESDKSSMEEKKSELGTQMKAADARIQDISSMEREFLADKQAKQAEMKQVQAALDAIFAEINRNSNSPYVGGEMLWPVPSLGQVTCGYGWRFGNSDFHTGMDISGGGAYGSSIVAANSGTVKVANTSFTQGYGYGKYVIIDHGGGMQTLYGHCSALKVSVGQYVSRGEKIAEVGSTGWSTGPHLHFEVRKGGKAVEPSAYLRGTAG